MSESKSESVSDSVKACKFYLYTMVVTSVNIMNMDLIMHMIVPWSAKVISAISITPITSVIYNICMRD